MLRTVSMYSSLSYVMGWSSMVHFSFTQTDNNKEFDVNSFVMALTAAAYCQNAVIV